MKLKIEKLVSDGFGLAHAPDGRVIFIKKTSPGDVVNAEIYKKQKDFAFAKVEKIISPSCDRILPKCQYFEPCGGCDYQMLSSQNQLKYKNEIVAEILHRAKVDAKPEKIIAGSNQELGYRNSIRFIFEIDDKNHIHLGRHNYLDERKFVIVDKCLLASEKVNEIAQAIRDTINESDGEKSSFWQLKIRQGFATNEIMVEIITSTENLPVKKELIDELKKFPEIKSIYQTIASGKSLKHLQRRLLFGSSLIHEKIGGFIFQISPESFFQTNSLGVKTLYDKIKEFADIKFGDEVVDLFCGTGSIGIYLSTLAKKVVGVEIVPEAIRDARDNARLNKISNCEFIIRDSTKWIKQNINKKIDKIIVDPPRAGLSKDLIFDLCLLNFDLIVYVSCNPATFARDLKIFESRGVVATNIQPIDMFPQTHHIEIVSKLTKIK
ncbi:MAG: 23S rRNA (uracil(1939)-C(5))-methyltransferase RlmD [Candidatus Berkelbacteria bacterium]|nr:23S rRNA (uracil(1939)-C(5))-methyltransferase RlmD [Candidatus Berkelbacteria bacterium]